MPRYRRRIATGSVQHVVSRFVNRQFLLDEPHARTEYLARAAASFGRSDWTALGYALMSSHVHWAARAGSLPSGRLIRSLHAGFAGWLNRGTGRLGPVFADRHRSVECRGPSAAAVLAYIHNNPVRAGVVGDPADSRWTSHRAYLGLDPAPPWLDVELGLQACGFDATARGRAAFHAFVCARSGEPRRDDLVGADLQERRHAARRLAAAPVEIASPHADGAINALLIEAPVVIPELSPIRPRWSGTPLEVIERVAEATGVDAELQRGRSRERRVSAARRLALLVWCRALARPVTPMAAALGISTSSACDALSKSGPDQRAEARRLAQVVLDARAEVASCDAPGFRCETEKT